jgi:hypothetical protein
MNSNPTIFLIRYGPNQSVFDQFQQKPLNFVTLDPTMMKCHIKFFFEASPPTRATCHRGSALRVGARFLLWDVRLPECS